MQFWSNLNNYDVFFLISHKQLLRKSVAETVLRGLPDTAFQNPPTPLKLAYSPVTRSQKTLSLGKMWTRVQSAQPLLPFLLSIFIL